jgi:hypothetical protein
MENTATPEVARLKAEKAALVQALALIITAADNAGCFLYCSGVDTSHPLCRELRNALCDALQASGTALDKATTANEYEAAFEGYDTAQDVQREMLTKATQRLRSKVHELYLVQTATGGTN